MHRSWPLYLLLNFLAAAPAVATPAPATQPGQESAHKWLRRASSEARAAELYKTSPFSQSSLISFIAAAQARLQDRDGLRLTHQYMSQRAAGCRDPVGLVLNHGVLAYLALRLDDPPLYRTHLEKAHAALKTIGVDDERFLLLECYISTITAIAGDAEGAARAARAATQPHHRARMHLALAIAALDRKDLVGFHRHIEQLQWSAKGAKVDRSLYSLSDAFIRAGDLAAAADAAFAIVDYRDRHQALWMVLDQQFEKEPKAYEANLTLALKRAQTAATPGDQARELAELIHGQLTRRDTAGLKRTLPLLVELSTIVADRVLDYPILAAAHSAVGNEAAFKGAMEKCPAHHQVRLSYALALGGNLPMARQIAEKQPDAFLHMTFAIAEAKRGDMARAAHDYSLVTRAEQQAVGARQIAFQWARRGEVIALSKWIDELKMPAQRAHAAFGAAEGLHGKHFYDPINIEIFGFGFDAQ